MKRFLVKKKNSDASSATANERIDASLIVVSAEIHHSQRYALHSSYAALDSACNRPDRLTKRFMIQMRLYLLRNRPMA